MWNETGTFRPKFSRKIRNRMKIVPFCFVFWIGMECFGHSGRNGTELTTLIKRIKIKTKKYKPSLPKKKLVTWHFLPLLLPLKNKLNLTLYFTLPNSPTLLVLHSRNVHFFFSTLIAHHQVTSTSSSSSTITQHLFAAHTSFSIFTTAINPTLV
jgi:hypothetical protein